MREWPVPNRWTSPPAAIASAHHRLASSMASACVAAIRSRTSVAAVIQARAGSVIVAELIDLRAASVAALGRRWSGARPGAGQPGLACPEVVDDRLGRRGADPRHAEGHDLE